MSSFFHFVNRQVQDKKNRFRFLFLSIFLTLHLCFYFYFFSEPITISLPHASSEDDTVYNYFSPLHIIGYIFGSIWIIDLGLACVRSVYNENRLTKSIERGTKFITNISEDEFIPRTVILNQLKEILQPTKHHSFYHMICGKFGTGKTLLIKMASKEVGHGIIYVDVPSDIKDFGIVFGKALNFAFEEDITLTRQLIRKIGGSANDESNDPKWKRALNAFKRIAKVYQEKYNRPPVIIYDNVNRLALLAPDILNVLQDDAKDNADDSNYIAVFVCSEGVVPKIMMSRSAWSRAIVPPMEINDINEEDSMKYLIEKRKVDKEMAKELYQLVGGHILELKIIANGVLAGQSIKDIKKQKLIEIEEKFSSAKLLKEQKYHEIGKRAIEALMASKEIDIYKFKDFFKNNVEEYQEVLGANVFAFHPSSNTVSFQSRSIEFYIQENSSTFDLFNLGLTDDTNEFNSN